jgi:Ribbon-helix-helix domain
MGKIRKQVYLDPAQDQQLKDISGQTGLSEAELIRQAIDQSLLGATGTVRIDLAAWDTEKAFIQKCLVSKPQPGGRDWQRSDLYER